MKIIFIRSGGHLEDQKFKIWISKSGLRYQHQIFTSCYTYKNSNLVPLATLKTDFSSRLFQTSRGCRGHIFWATPMKLGEFVAFMEVYKLHYYDFFLFILLFKSCQKWWSLPLRFSELLAWAYFSSINNNCRQSSQLSFCRACEYNLNWRIFVPAQHQSDLLKH